MLGGKRRLLTQSACSACVGGGIHAWPTATNRNVLARQPTTGSHRPSACLPAACLQGGRTTGPPAPGRQHIDCPCGAQSDDLTDTQGYSGLWLCCEACRAWVHGPCVGVMKRAPRGAWVCSRCMRAQASAQVR